MEWTIQYAIFTISSAIFVLTIGVAGYFLNKSAEDEVNMYKDLIHTLFKGEDEKSDDVI